MNAAPTITATMESIGQQAFPGLQHVVKDGGSTDGTMDLVGQASGHKPVVSTLPDSGISDAFNQGIELCDGDIIGIVSADDCLPAGTLDAVSRASLRWPDADVLFGDAIVIDGSDSYRVAPIGSVSAMQYQHVILHAATWVRRAAYERWGLFNTDLRFAMDYELLLRFHRAGAQFQYVPEVLGSYATGGINSRHRIATMREVARISKLHGGSSARSEAVFLSKFAKHLAKTAMPARVRTPLLDMYRRARGRHRPT